MFLLRAPRNAGGESESATTSSEKISTEVERTTAKEYIGPEIVSNLKFKKYQSSLKAGKKPVG